MPTSPLPAALVADANAVLSAIIGGRARVVFIDPAAPRIFGTAHVADEITRHLPYLAIKRHIAETDLVTALRLLPIVWHDLSVYGN